eukprot:g1239.t1
MSQATSADVARMDAWREKKTIEWADETSKLRAKHPSREAFEAWMDRQCEKALRRKAEKKSGEGKEALTQEQAWSAGLAPPDLYEWFANCYQMRCDDDYAYGGGNLHGPYNPEATPEDIKIDFMAFCLLAARRRVVPPGWDWPAFLAVAAAFVSFAFEKSDAQERWGSENVFAAVAGGRSLRFTGESVYGTSCQQSFMDDEPEENQLAESDSAEPTDATLDEIGGRAAWDEFVAKLSTSRRFDHPLERF